MDAHMRYYKQVKNENLSFHLSFPINLLLQSEVISLAIQGYELLSQIEPFIHQVYNLFRKRKKLES